MPPKLNFSQYSESCLLNLRTGKSVQGDNIEGCSCCTFWRDLMQLFTDFCCVVTQWLFVFGKFVIILTEHLWSLGTGGCISCLEHWTSAMSNRGKLNSFFSYRNDVLFIANQELWTFVWVRGSSGFSDNFAIDFSLANAGFSWHICPSVISLIPIATDHTLGSKQKMVLSLNGWDIYPRSQICMGHWLTERVIVISFVLLHHLSLNDISSPCQESPGKCDVTTINPDITETNTARTMTDDVHSVCIPIAQATKVNLLPWLVFLVSFCIKFFIL